MGKRVGRREGVAQPETFPLTGWPVDPCELDLHRSRGLKVTLSNHSWKGLHSPSANTLGQFAEKIHIPSLHTDKD